MKILTLIGLSIISFTAISAPIDETLIIYDPNPMYQLPLNPPYTPDENISQIDVVQCYFQKDNSLDIQEYEGTITKVTKKAITLENDRGVIYLPTKNCLIQRGYHESN